jgi:formylglycine-generating enzyme required for sulfatase activity
MLLGAGLWGLLPRHDTVEREIVDPVPTRTEVVGMVTIPSSRPFQLAVLETSRAAFSALASLVDCDPSYGREAAMPATCVSFADALEFCNRATRALNEQNKGASVTEAYALQKGHWTWNPEASGYRLPTAGEWRLAAEALPKDQPLTRLAWFDQPISGGRFRTATLIPTTHGIHDLVGNAWEWVWPDDKTSLASTDPVQAMGGALFCPARVSAENPVKFAASADSVSSAKGLQDRSSAFGFRMARNVEEPTSRTEAVKVLRIPGLLTWLSLILGFVGVVGSLFLLKTRTRPS